MNFKNERKWLVSGVLCVPTLGAARLGTLPDPSQLSRVARVGDHPGDASGGLKEHLTKQLKMAVEEEPWQSINAPQHFLGAPSFPTITSKLTPKILGLKFVEMEEFLPTVQALDQFTPESVWDGLLGTLHQFQQQQQGHGVADITMWTRCFSLYVAVMA